MEIRSVGASLPSVVSDRTDRGKKEVQAEQSAERTSAKQEDKPSPAVQNFELVSFKAFFSVDENKNVVIKIADADGKVVRQIPPAEYLKLAETLSESGRHLFHLEA